MPQRLVGYRANVFQYGASLETVFGQKILISWTKMRQLRIHIQLMQRKSIQSLSSTWNDPAFAGRSAVSFEVRSRNHKLDAMRGRTCFE